MQPLTPGMRSTQWTRRPADVYEDADRQRYVSGLKAFDDAARTAHGKGGCRVDQTAADGAGAKATEVLQYAAVPGEFKGCVPVAQAGNGKSWALEASRRF